MKDRGVSSQERRFVVMVREITQDSLVRGLADTHSEAAATARVASRGLSMHRSIHPPWSRESKEKIKPDHPSLRQPEDRRLSTSEGNLHTDGHRTTRSSSVLRCVPKVGQIRGALLFRASLSPPYPTDRSKHTTPTHCTNQRTSSTFMSIEFRL